MRIVVCVKHVPNIHSDRAFAGGRVVRGAEDGSLNELDEHAIEAALQVVEALGDAERATAEVVALTVGPEESGDALRRAFQLGVGVGVQVTDDALAGSDYLGTAAALAAAVRRIGAERGPVDLVLAGMAALDGLGSVVPALLAAELELPQLTNAEMLSVAQGRAAVQRAVDGVTEVLDAPLPAVVSLTDQANKPRFPNFKAMMAARGREITRWTLADLALDPAQVGEAGARTEVLSAEPRPHRAPVELVVDEGEGGLALADFILRTETGLADAAGVEPVGRPGAAAEHTTLVVVDDATAPLASTELELLTAARALGEVAVATFGPADAVLPQLAAYGAERVYELDVDGERFLTPVAAHALEAAVDATAADVVLLSATFANKEVAAVLALRTGAGLVIDAARVEVAPDGRVVGAKRVFAGSWDLECASRTERAVLTVRANAVVPVPADVASEPARIPLPVAAGDEARDVQLVAREVPSPADGPERPALAAASVVVAGGRGTFGDFGPVEDLADALGAAVGTTRDCVDEGWMPHDAQIGQTGVTIAPRLYVGAGISGAPHHRGGMQASEVIVAVNSDPECPIFEICDFAVVGDLATVLPQAAAAIRAARETP